MKNKKHSLLLSFVLFILLPLSIKADDKLIPLWDGWWQNEGDSFSRITHIDKEPHGNRLLARYGLREEDVNEKSWHIGMLFQLGDTHKIKSGYELELYFASEYHKPRTFGVFATTITWDHEYGAGIDELTSLGLFKYHPDKMGHTVNVDHKKVELIIEESLHISPQMPFTVFGDELNDFIRKNHGKKIAIIISAESGGAGFYGTHSSNPEDLIPHIRLESTNSKDKDIFKQMVKKSAKMRVDE